MVQVVALRPGVPEHDMDVVSESAAAPPRLTVRLGAEGFSKHLGGVRRVAFELASAIADRGVEVTAQLPDLNEMARLDRWLTSFPGRVGRQARDAAALARRKPGRIAHALYYDPALLLSRDPLVVTVYDMIHEQYGDPRRLLTTLKRVAVRRADAVVAISESTAADVLAFFPAMGAVEVIYPGISQAIIDSPRTSSGGSDIPIGREHMLYVGRRGGYKNFALLVDALALSPELRQLPLVLVGGGRLDDDERAALLNVLPEDRVHHLDHLPEHRLIECYDRALVTVVPSKIEGFGLPLLEAMARRSPVACSTASSLVEIAGGHASLFDPSAPEDLATAVLSALDRPAVELDAAHRHARQFTWHRSAQRYVELYESLL